MRKYIRHPTDVPIEYQLNEDIEYKKENLRNISIGGLCFQSSVCIEEGTMLVIKIPTIENEFTATGRVAWCTKNNGSYDVGVQFMDSDTAFRVRMIEQICYIEQYRKEILKSENRKLSGEEAAREWVAKYARDFPDVI